MTKPLAGLLFSVALLGKVNAPAPTTPRVQAIRFWSFGDVTRVAIQLDGRYKLKSDLIEHPYRLYFDLNGVRPRSTAHHGVEVIQVSDQRLKQIRVAQVSPGTTRIVFDLQSAMEVTSSQLINPERLIVEIKPKADSLVAGKDGMTAKAVTRQTGRDNQAGPSKASTATNSGTSTAVSISGSPSAAPVAAAVDHAASEMAQSEGKQAEAKHAEGTAPDPKKGDGAQANVGGQAAASPIHTAHNAPESSIPGVRPVLDASISRSRAPAPRPNIQAAGSPVIQQAAGGNGPSLQSSESTVVPNPAIAALSRKDHAVDRSLVRLFGLKLGRVVIDAGHGGHDTGTIGPNGLLEKDLVLDVALRLGALISSQMGADVVYTRSSDVFIPLEDRTKIANDQKADLFISIHANSSPERTATGVETYYFNLTSDRRGLNVATRENATATSSISDLNDLLHRAVLQAKLEESREFAQAVQGPLWNMSVRMNPQSRNRGVRQAPFVVLIGATMPSILAEVGFVSNNHDERLLKRTEQRQKIAESLFKGITSYASALSHTQQIAKNN